MSTTETALTAHLVVPEGQNDKFLYNIAKSFTINSKLLILLSRSKMNLEMKAIADINSFLKGKLEMTAVECFCVFANVAIAVNLFLIWSKINTLIFFSPGNRIGNFRMI